MGFQPSRAKFVVETDGGSRGNPGPAGAGALIKRGDTGEILWQSGEYLGETTNNVAEYRALIMAYEALTEFPDGDVEVRADSKLVVSQMSGAWKIKDANIRKLALHARDLIASRRVTYTWVPRAQNAAADALANRAMDAKATVGEKSTAPTHKSAFTELSEEGNLFSSFPSPQDNQASRQKDNRPLTLLLIRHGVTDHNESNIAAGGDDIGLPLNERGQEQAQNAAELLVRMAAINPSLAAPSRVIASPMQRTLDTAEIIAERLGVETEVDKRLAEIRLGEWHHQPSAVMYSDLARLAAWVHGEYSPLGGENLSEVRARLQQWLGEAMQKYSGETLVLAVHAGIIHVFTSIFFGGNSNQEGFSEVPPASLSIMKIIPGLPPQIIALGIPSELVK